MPNAFVRRGREALAKGAWEDAHRAFEAAVQQTASAEALEGLGTACWWLNDGPRVFESREEAYPYRLTKGGYRLENRFRYVVARRD